MKRVYENVECTCGCTVGAGEEVRVLVTRNHTSLVYCEECAGKALKEEPEDLKEEDVLDALEAADIYGLVVETETEDDADEWNDWFE